MNKLGLNVKPSILGLAIVLALSIITGLSISCSTSGFHKTANGDQSTASLSIGSASEESTPVIPDGSFFDSLPGSNARQAARVLAEVNALPTPDGCDSRAFDRLKREFLRLMLDPSMSRRISTPPTGAANAIDDLWVVDQGGGNWNLTWSYRNVGDYDQTGEVGVPDITPIAQHYLHARDGLGQWTDALDEVIDGDASGDVGISDITPIAQNYLATVTGYAIETASSEAGGWNEIATIPLDAGNADARKTFSVPIPVDALEFVRVIPVGIGTERGDASNLVERTVAPPAITGVSPLSGIYTGDIARFIASFTGSQPFQFAWNFGGGVTPNTSTDEQPLVTLGAGGTYNCSVTITNPYGSDTFNFSIDIIQTGDAPLITFIDPTYGLTGTQITPVATVAGTQPFTYAWDFGGGAIPNNPTDASPTIALGAAGDYPSSLTVTSAFGTDTFDFNLFVSAEDTFPPVWDTTVGIQSLSSVSNTNTLELTFGRATDNVDTNPFYVIYWNTTANWNIADLQNMYSISLWDVDPAGAFPYTATLIGLQPGVEYTALVRCADHALPNPNFDDNTTTLTATVDANGLNVSGITPDVPDQPAGSIVVFAATVTGGDGNYNAVWSDNQPDYGYFFDPGVSGGTLTTRWGCAQGEVWPAIRVDVTDGSGHSGAMELYAYYVPAGTPLTFTSTVYPLISSSCASCHSGGGGGGLDLSSVSVAFNNLVGVDSTQQPAFKRIEAFDPENSYLVHKIQDRPSITGNRMPPGGPLTSGEIDTFQRWVIGGALE